MGARTLQILLLALGCCATATSEDTQWLRIQQLIHRGELASARRETQQALKKSPADARGYNFLGVIEAQERNRAAAEANFRRAIQLAPRFAGAYLNLGRLYQENSREDPTAMQKGLEIYRRLLEVEPDHVEANYQAAWMLNRRGAFALSEQHLKRLPAPARRRPQALALQCANQAALGRLSEARSTAGELLAHNELTEADVLAIVPVLAAHQSRDLALELLEGLSRRGLASGESLRQAAAIYESLGRLGEAREALERTTGLEPASAELLVRLARIAHRMEDRKAALGYLAHARDLEPNIAAVHFFFGIVCVELDLPQDAKESLERAVTLNSNNPYYNYALGALLVQENNADQAITYFEKFCAARPDDMRGRFALGVAYYYAYRLDAARQQLQAAAAGPETRMGAHLFLGRVAMQEGNLALAAEHFRQAIQANPAAPDAYAEMGLIQIRRKENELAEKTLTQALRIAPEHYLGNLYLLMLYQRSKDSRAAAQAQRVEQIKRAGEEKERLLIRTLKIQPY